MDGWWLCPWLEGTVQIRYKYSLHTPSIRFNHVTKYNDTNTVKIPIKLAWRADAFPRPRDCTHVHFQILPRPYGFGDQCWDSVIVIEGHGRHGLQIYVSGAYCNRLALCVSFTSVLIGRPFSKSAASLVHASDSASPTAVAPVFIKLFGCFW